MSQIDILRNSIIEKLLTISNKDYLAALHKLVENSKPDNDLVLLTEEQKLLLELSEEDIRNGRLISQDQLDKEDQKWLNSL